MKIISSCSGRVCFGFCFVLIGAFVVIHLGKQSIKYDTRAIHVLRSPILHVTRERIFNTIRTIRGAFVCITLLVCVIGGFAHWNRAIAGQDTHLGGTTRISTNVTSSQVKDSERSSKFNYESNVASFKMRQAASLHILLTRINYFADDKIISTFFEVRHSWLQSRYFKLGNTFLLRYFEVGTWGLDPGLLIGRHVSLACFAKVKVLDEFTTRRWLSTKMKPKQLVELVEPLPSPTSSWFEVVASKHLLLPEETRPLRAPRLVVAFCWKSYFFSEPGESRNLSLEMRFGYFIGPKVEVNNEMVTLQGRLLEISLAFTNKA